MYLIDKFQTTSIYLPSLGLVPIGLLPDGLDLQLLQTELTHFYGDRFQVVEQLPKAVEKQTETVETVNQAAAPKAKRKAHGF